MLSCFDYRNNNVCIPFRWDVPSTRRSHLNHMRDLKGIALINIIFLTTVQVSQVSLLISIVEDLIDFRLIWHLAWWGEIFRPRINSSLPTVSGYNRHSFHRVLQAVLTERLVINIRKAVVWSPRALYPDCLVCRYTPSSVTWWSLWSWIRLFILRVTCCYLVILVVWNHNGSERTFTEALQLCSSTVQINQSRLRSLSQIWFHAIASNWKT